MDSSITEKKRVGHSSFRNMPNIKREGVSEKEKPEQIVDEIKISAMIQPNSTNKKIISMVTQNITPIVDALPSFQSITRTIHRVRFINNITIPLPEKLRVTC
ncbi:hypothetical protein RF11_11525 [Thelohanellus kitauei]|uniref:Uncharacterized protein n=1 Tax=Thelohanellus kitauei TaxID=669202 RepID=A0A0C2J0S0_THEKT|nr:hypothetical protein RF11_11525 [Thelohanellus kitauei]